MDQEKTIAKMLRPESFLITDQGTRKYQQDNCFAEVRDLCGIAVLCDGMGGMNGGEQASALAVNFFAEDFRKAQPIKDIPGFLNREARKLDRMVAELKDEQGRRMNAGTTLVAVIVTGNHLYWLSVGDSRMYLIRNENMVCMTAAHNYKSMLQEKLSSGQIDIDYYNSEISQGEALTSYLGLGNLTLIDGNTEPFELWEDDILLLCSDGLYKTLTDEQIRALINESGYHVQIAGQRLIDTARRWGVRGQDNTTLVLLHMSAESQ